MTNRTLPRKPPRRPLARGTAVAVAAEPELDAAEISQGFKSSNPDHHVELLFLSIDDLTIDPNIQRGEEPGEIASIVENFNPAALGTLTAAARETRRGPKLVQSYSLLDGQQRRAALAILRTKGVYDQKVAVLVHHGLSIEEQAELFLLLNYRRSVGAMQRFKARLTAGEAKARAIKRILDDLQISFGNPPRGFMAIGRADDIFEEVNGPERLRWALTMIRDIYDEDHKGGCYDGRVMVAFGLLHRHFVMRGALDEQWLTKKLMSHSPVVNKLIGMGRMRKDVNGGDISYNIAMALVKIYNESKRGEVRKPSRLPDIPRQRRSTIIDLDDEQKELTQS